MEGKHTHIYIIVAVIAIILGSFAVMSLATHKEEEIAKKDTLVQQKQKVIAAIKKKEADKKPAKTDSVPFVDPTVRGTLTDSLGNPMKGVVVSDGYTCTVTNDKGMYIFLRDKNARFVWYSVPADCAIPTHSAEDHTALFYKSLSAKRNVYNFTLKRLPNGPERDYRLIVFGDPQVTNAFSPYYTGPNDNPVKKTDVARFTDETMADVKQTIAGWSPFYARLCHFHGRRRTILWWLQFLVGRPDP